MKPVITSREAMLKRAKKAGATPLPQGHPLRSEGPSILFLHHMQRPSPQKNIDPDQKGSTNSSDTSEEE